VKGGPGNDRLDGGGDTDMCEGGPGVDGPFVDCEECGDPDGDCP